MTDKEIALEIAQVILRYRMRNLAFDTVLDLYRFQGYQLDWQHRVREAQDELLSSPTFADRIVELKNAFEETKTAGDLIQVLHREFLRKNPEDDPPFA